MEQLPHTGIEHASYPPLGKLTCAVNFAALSLPAYRIDDYVEVNKWDTDLPIKAPVADTREPTSEAQRQRRNLRNADAAKIPYVNRGIAIAYYLARLGVCHVPTLEAALLVDTANQCFRKDFSKFSEQLEICFGEEVKDIVMECIDDPNVVQKCSDKQVRHAAECIKLAAKLHDVVDLEHETPTSWRRGQLESIYTDYLKRVPKENAEDLSAKGITKAPEPARPPTYLLDTEAIKYIINMDENICPKDDSIGFLSSATRTAEEQMLVTYLKTLNFAAHKHMCQRRKGFEAIPYINHPIGVAFHNVQSGCYTLEVLQSSLLHDTIEDTLTTEEELLDLFGETVKSVVMECTDNVLLTGEERKRAEVASACHKSYFAKCVKCGDKFDNCTSLMNELPPNWTDVRRVAYIRNASRIIKNLNLDNTWFREQFKKLFARAGVEVDYNEEKKTPVSVVEEAVCVSSVNEEEKTPVSVVEEAVCVSMNEEKKTPISVVEAVCGSLNEEKKTPISIVEAVCGSLNEEKTTPMSVVEEAVFVS